MSADRGTNAGASCVNNGSNDFTLSLNNFSGPLDLLLHLVKEAKIEIKDIFVSEVTAQFLSYMAFLDSVDVNKAAEYMETAAILLEIKSRSLLPAPPSDTLDAELPENVLMRRLEEYKLFKQLSGILKEKEAVDRLYKLPGSELSDPKFVPKDISLDGLLDAFLGVMARVELDRFKAENPGKIKNDSFSVADKIRYIQESFFESERLSFFSLIKHAESRNEIVVTFIALLELLKLQAVFARQDQEFGDILLMRNENFNGEITLSVGTEFE